MNTCKTCKHRREAGEYQNWHQFGLGECAKMPMFWDATEWGDDQDEYGDTVRRLKPAYAAQKAFVQDASDYRAYLIVADDFGCVMHEDT
jgi:hypothetical protein